MQTLAHTWQSMGRAGGCALQVIRIQLNFLMNCSRPSESVQTLGVIDTNGVCIEGSPQTSNVCSSEKLGAKSENWERLLSSAGFDDSVTVSVVKAWSPSPELSLDYHKRFKVTGEGKQMLSSQSNRWRPTVVGERISIALV